MAGCSAQSPYLWMRKSEKYSNRLNPRDYNEGATSLCRNISLLLLSKQDKTYVKKRQQNLLIHLKIVFYSHNFPVHFQLLYVGFFSEVWY